MADHRERQFDPIKRVGRGSLDVFRELRSIFVLVFCHSERSRHSTISSSGLEPFHITHQLSGLLHPSHISPTRSKTESNPNGKGIVPFKMTAKFATLSRREYMQLGGESSKDTSCHICKELFVESTETRHQLPCGHSFGHQCLIEWAKRNNGIQRAQNCMHCRAIFYIWTSGDQTSLEPHNNERELGEVNIDDGLASIIFFLLLMSLLVSFILLCLHLS